MRTLDCKPGYLTCILLFCLVFTFSAQSQQNIVFDPIENGPYGKGSSIAVLFKPQGVFPVNTVFELHLSDVTGNFPGTKIGEYQRHYTKFINGIIPATAIASNNYKLKIIARSGGVVVTEAESPNQIRVGSGTGQSTAFLTVRNWGDFRPASGVNMWAFGVCSGNANNLSLERKVQRDIDLVLKNEFDTTAAYATDVPRTFTIAADGPFPISDIKKVHYSLYSKIVEDDGTISTQAYFLINNQTTGPFSAVLNTVCFSVGNPGVFQFKVDLDRVIRGSPSAYYNFPGNTYLATWDDNTTNSVFTIQNADAQGGLLSHAYSVSSCGRTVNTNNNVYANSIGPSLKVENFNNTCNQSVNVVTPIQVFEKPVINFTAPATACQGSSVTFTNTSTLGLQGSSAVGSVCAPPAITYDWYVDNVYKSSAVSFTTNSLSPGRHTIKLVPSYDQNAVSCIPETVSKEICITATPIADFKINNGAALRDCAPITAAITNTTNAAACGTYTYTYSVLNADGTTAPVTAYTLPANTDNPNIRFHTPGEYLIRLVVNSTCGSSTKEIPVSILGVTNAPFPTAPVYCVNNTVINFETNAAHKPDYNAGPAGTDVYNWVITGGNFSFQNSTTAASRYPVINFADYGTYTVSLTYTNNCGTATSQQTIRINRKPQLSIPADALFCIGQQAGPFPFTSTDNGTITWALSGAAIGFTPTTGTGDLPVFTTANSTNVSLVATINVSALKDGCTTTLPLTLTVYPKPAAPAANAVVYCQGATATPLTATATNGHSLRWYTTPNGTAATTAPTPATIATGVTSYYVSQVNTTTGCESDQTRIDVTITSNPQISSPSSTDVTTCGGANGSIILNGMVANAVYTVHYTRNGVAASRSGVTATGTGQLTLDRLSAGTYTNVYVAANSCSSGSVGPFTISEPVAPAIPALTSNGPLCSGATLQLTAQTTAAGNVAYTWSGPNGYTSGVQNPTLTAVTPAASGTYQVTASLNNCTSTATINVVVNPLPATPVVATPINYCINATAAQLSATPASGMSLHWFSDNNRTTELPQAPTPVTSSTGNFDFFVAHKNSQGCFSIPAVIQVSVSPAISKNTIGGVQTICSGQTPAQLQPTENIEGGTGTYTYQWQRYNVTLSDWENIPNATAAFYTPGALAVNTRFRRIAYSGPCAGTNSNEVLITVLPALGNKDIGAAQSICSGTAPQELIGQLPTGGNGTYIYLWEQSVNGTTWTSTGVTTVNYQPPVLTQNTYYRRKVDGGNCTDVSNTVLITVNPIPAITQVSEQVLCNGSAIGTRNFTATPTDGVVFTWTNDNTAIGLAASGTGGLPAFTATNYGKVPELAHMEVRAMRTANDASCASEPMRYNILVLPTITINQFADTTVCSGATIALRTPFNDAGTFSGGSVSYTWTVSGSGINLQAGQGVAVPAFTATNTGTANMVANITVTPVYRYGSFACNGTPMTYSLTTRPAAPAANAGTDINLCAASTYTMRATSAGFATGTWSLVSGAGATFDNVNDPITQIRNLQPGATYVFKWTVSVANGCPETSDEVSVQITPALVNTITTTPLTICSGQSINILGQAATGGSGTYQYEWQFSTNRTNWSPINGQTGTSLVYTPQQSGFVRRVVRSAPCTDEGQEVVVTVQAAVSNNTISASQTLCIGNPTQLLVGSDPAGANGAFLYQWEQSTNGVNWTFINGAVSRDYQPGTLSATTHFRRIVSSNLCAGPQSNTSQPVTITINPDAVASFRLSRDTACAPFNINSSVVTLQPDATRNGSYQWYANGNLLGSGNSFPGYVLQGSNDFVDIKLKAISRFGCKADSMERRLHTYTNPQPAFAMTTTGGCGPLSVQFNNNTPNPGQYRFYWNFGNGRSSTLAQPGAILFASNPSFGDTTYTVTLHAISACDTFRVSQQVRVGSLPKALFTPSKTVGCSPMQVSFRNTSRGIGNSYRWDFGDGTIANRATADTISHTFITAVRDTFFVKLIATNTCGTDTARFAVVVSPNTIVLDFAVNGNEQAGCTPHAVRFINNTRGAASFRWDFGDGNILSTTRNQDTVAHLYRQPGNYIVRLFATNGCTDTSSTEAVTVYPKPKAAFSASQYTLCIGEEVQFQNSSDSATGYSWQFGDGATSTATNPVHQYRNPGLYTVMLTGLRANSAGSVCPDSVAQQINVVQSQRGWFTASDTVGACAPLTVTFTNRNTPATSAVWNFGDGTTATGDVVTHTFQVAGIYTVKLVAQAPGGCVYETLRTITVNGPSGRLVYSNAVLCNDNAVRLQVQGSGMDTLIWNFGDGVVLKTTTNVVYHNYANGGKYRPSVTLLNRAGCSVLLQGADSINVDKIKADFTFVENRLCGGTTLQFRESARAYSGQAAATWKFGDGTTGAGVQPIHTYTNSGAYPVQLITTSMGGCQDTLTRMVPVKVNDIPSADIIAQALGCTRSNTQFSSSIRAVDAIGSINWSLSNGVQSNTAAFDYTFARAGVYNVQLTIGTVNGCYDTVAQTITINTSPDVTVSADKRLCLGEQTTLSATGATRYSWSPIAGLSCANCADPVASPTITTTYVVTGTNNAGCTDADTVLVSVVQPLRMRLSPNDSICIGSATLLQASGATTYQWTPATGLSNAAIANPLARPDATTIYRVVGYDGFNCFTDTAFVTVAVGTEPAISLGPDLTLSTGTQLPLRTVVQNGPIRTWEWSPATDLSCASCPQPTAYIRKDITYTVKGTTPYGCVDTDTISIKVFCEGSQVFIPNAFTPDGDGVNDILMVRGKGIALVKTFRVFNRWGEVVFEKSSFRPNDPMYGWDGKVRGVAGQPEVYVYTAEVVCDNGGTYTYKGNTSLLK